MVQTIERCDRILRIAAHSPGGVKLNDIAEQMELKYSTVYNLAASLLQCGMLEKEENLFFPGPAFGELNTLRRNRLYLNHMRKEIIRLSRFSKPHSFVFSIPHGTQIHALLWKEIEQREPQRVLQFLPPLDSVAGLVMLAWLPPKEAEQMLAAHLADPVFIQKWNGSREKLDRSLALCRQNGYSALPYEAPGTLRIAVPVFGDRTFIGALTWTRRTSDPSELGAMLPHLRDLENPQTEPTTPETPFQA